MAEGHREAARSVIDGREHDGTLAAEGRQSTSMRHIAVYVRILTAANTRRIVAADISEHRSSHRPSTVSVAVLATVRVQENLVRPCDGTMGLASADLWEAGSKARR